MTWVEFGHIIVGMATNKSIRPDEYVIDPLFPIPEGLRDFTYEDREYPFDPDYAYPDSDVEDVSTGEEGQGEEEDVVPAVPKTFRVIKQTIREKADGSQVVDLTVEVETVLGADKYEFRITNKDTGKSTIV